MNNDGTRKYNPYATGVKIGIGALLGYIGLRYVYGKMTRRVIGLGLIGGTALGIITYEFITTSTPKIIDGYFRIEEKKIDRDMKLFEYQLPDTIRTRKSLDERTMQVYNQRGRR